jgi:gas vesicle protein
MGSGRFWIGVAIGAAVGVTLAIVHAPMPGEEARARLAQRREHWRARYRERKRVMLLRAQGKITGKVGEAVARAGRAEQEAAERA